MLNQQERDTINDLFDRIEAAARKSPPREAEAEALLQQRLRDYPSSPYYMAQTILVQEQALRSARERIEELEARQQSGGGFLGGLFGGEEPVQQGRRTRGPWDRRDDNEAARGQGGGFLAGAAQTALGVTGGLLLGSAVAGMLGGGAEASEYEPDTSQEPAEDMQSGDADFGDDDFDMGGDF